MSTPKKRTYTSAAREAQSRETRKRVLDSAKKLFETKGFDKVTIDEIAKEAKISSPSIYAIFQSKRGILLGLMDEALPTEQFEALVEKGKLEKSPRKRLEITAYLSRRLYDAEKNQIGFLRGISIVDPLFKEVELERERRRYHRQKETIETLAKEKVLSKKHTLSQARDIFWMFTGRDLYRMLVIERGWSSGIYEKWLADLLVKALLSSKS